MPIRQVDPALPEDPPKGKLAWTDPEFEIVNETDVGLDPIAYLDVEAGRGYTLDLVYRAKLALQHLRHGLSAPRYWVLDGLYNAPLLLTASPGPREGGAVALVAPRNPSTEPPDADLVGEKHWVPGYVHTIALARWPVWFEPADGDA